MIGFNDEKMKRFLRFIWERVKRGSSADTDLVLNEESLSKEKIVLHSAMSVIQDFDLYGTSCDISSASLSQLKLNINNSNIAGYYHGVPIEVSSLHPKAMNADFTPKWLFEARNARKPDFYLGYKDELIPFLKKNKKNLFYAAALSTAIVYGPVYGPPAIYRVIMYSRRFKTEVLDAISFCQ